MPKINNLKAREVLDSRGNPTVEVEVLIKNSRCSAIVPSGASKGKYEARELRDNTHRYNHQGVLKAVNNVNTIIKKHLLNHEIKSQRELDSLMVKLDGTFNKRRLGANSILGVSLAYARASAQNSNIPLYEYISNIYGNKNYTLPIPFMNVINGGLHAGNSLAFQEYMVVPVGKNFSESLRMGSETYHELKSLIQKKYGRSSINVGDEGGFAPNLSDVREPLKLITRAIDSLGYSKNIYIAIDAAASSFYKNGFYIINKSKYSADKLSRIYESLIKEYNLISIEDPFEETKYSDFRKLLKRNPKLEVVGDDLLVTNIDMIKKAISLKSCNCLLLKLNQIGTLTESLDAATLAKNNKWSTIVSHRSGETEDSFIADLAVGISSNHIKSGAPARGERVSKYNRLLRIEEELGNKARFPKKPFINQEKASIFERFIRNS
jgi:enolase